MMSTNFEQNIVQNPIIEAQPFIYSSSITDFLELKAKLSGSFLLFTQFFYKLRTGRDFQISEPIGRESHYITVCKKLTEVVNGKCHRLYINIPPRYGKTELLIHFIAWTLARFPSSNYIYVSYSHSLAKKQTQTIRSIIQLPLYRKIFNIHLSEESSAKDNFETSHGGSVYAVGAEGTIVGRGAGIHALSTFGGAIVIDDIHKPIEVTSDVRRETIKEWWFNTLISRTNSPTTPIIGLGQRLHEDDLPANLIKSGDWQTLILPALDIHDHALHPGLHTTEALLKMKEESPYNFAAQYQQNPQPAGGGILKPEWFYLTDEEPEIMMTFITADTAETDKSYNDATVFSFWGLYKIKNFERETDIWGLHWLDCAELRIEPKDLQSEFMMFYQDCMLHSVKPTLAAIEKKSTGVTLVSILKEMRGLKIMEIERNANSFNKSHRFLHLQPYIATRKVSLPRYGKHTAMCLEHCRKITANNSHRYDDICDTLYDAVKIALMDKALSGYFSPHHTSDKIVSKFSQQFNKQKMLQDARKWQI